MIQPLLRSSRVEIRPLPYMIHPCSSNWSVALLCNLVFCSLYNNALKSLWWSMMQGTRLRGCCTLFFMMLYILLVLMGGFWWIPFEVDLCSWNAYCQKKYNDLWFFPFKKYWIWFYYWYTNERFPHSGFNFRCIHHGTCLGERRRSNRENTASLSGSLWAQLLSA